MIILFQANLPAPPQPFLPLIPEWVVKLAKYTPLTLLFLAIVFGFLWWLYKKQKDWIEPKPYIPEEVPVVNQKTFFQELDSIRKKHAKAQSFRMGLHEISMRLKTYLETISGKQVEEMTSEEITEHISTDLGNLFRKLALAQFGEPEPTSTEYHHLFDKIGSVARTYEKEPRKI
jgi:hypothetical protein